MEIAIVILLVILIAVAVWGFTRKQKEQPNEQLQLLQNQFQSQFGALNQTLETRLGESVRVMNERLKENRESFERSTQNFQSKISDFTAGIVGVKESLNKVGESVKEVSSFQQIFRTPKLRGRWGEMALEHILADYFPRDMFELQHYFKSGEAVDAILKLPDGKILPIDSKFPLEHFERMNSVLGDEERESAKKLFTTEVNREIDDIANKYILPSEDTTSVAFMYIPAEAVYFEINNSLSSVTEYARKKKVFISSPNTFYLMLQVVQQWTQDIQISRQTQELVKRLNQVVADAGKLNESFMKLGKHLNDARSSYDDSEKRLSLFVDRTKRVIELGSQNTERLDAPQRRNNEK